MHTKKHYTKYVHKSLQVRFGIYVIVSALLLIVFIVRIVLSRINVFLPVGGFLAGGLLGIFLTRIYKIDWDENANKVMFRLDLYSIIILILYIVFEIYREKIVEQFVNGPAVAITSFSVLTGIIIGRVLGMRRKIIGILEENI